MSGGGFAVTRRAALSLVVLCLGVAAHCADGGMVPSATGLWLALALTLAMTAALTPWRPSRPRLVAFVIGSQVVLHAVFVATSGSLLASPGGMGMSMGSAADPFGVPTGAGAPGLTAMHLIPSGTMLAGHLLASVAAALALAHGESALRAWTALLSAAFSLLPARPGPLPRRRTRALVADPFRSFDTAQRRHVGRRGPPLGPLHPHVRHA